MFPLNIWQANNGKDIKRIEQDGKLIWDRCVEQTMNPFVGSRDTALRKLEAIAAMEQGKWTRPAITVTPRSNNTVTQSGDVYTWTGSYYCMVNFNQDIPVGATVNFKFEMVEGTEQNMTYCTWQFTDGTEGKSAFDSTITSAVVPEKPVKALYFYKSNAEAKTTQKFRITECAFTMDAVSPATPVSIYGNNGVLGLSENLFNMNAPLANLETISSTGAINNYVGIKITDKAGNYYASAINPNKRNVYYYLAIYDPTTKKYTNPPNIKFFIWNTGASKGSLTLPEGYELWLYNASSVGKNLDYIEEMDIMVAKGENPVTYEPYGVIQKGEQSEATVRGKNLFGDWVCRWVTADGRDMSYPDNSQGYYCSDYIPVKPDTSYVLCANGDAKVSGIYSMIIAEYDANKKFLVRTLTSLGAVNIKKLRSDTAFVLAAAAVNNFLNVSATQEQFEQLKLQFEEGTSATPYQPYLAPQSAPVVDLYAVGTYKDTYDAVSGKVTRRCGAVMWDGSEQWNKNGTTSYYTAVLSRVNGMSCPYICSHSKNLQLFMTTNVGFKVSELPESVTDVDTFKAWLKAQYDAGTPVIFVFPLNTETTEQAEPHALVQYRGITQTAGVESKFVDCGVDVVSMGEN